MTGVSSVMVVTGVSGVTGWAIEGKETMEEKETGRKKEERKENGGEELLANLACLKKNKSVQV